MDTQEVMKEFLADLKESYRERQLSCEEQWPPVSVEKLVNLQLVEAERKEGFRAGLHQHGAGDDNVKRTPILHGDLFKADKGKKPVRKAIVEGNAGIGKTTLCTMLTEEWGEGKILTQFDCILMLPLRDRMASSASSLTDLLALYHPDENICECVAQQMKRTKGKGVLIIADGWDELDEVNRSKQSFFYNLLFGRLLPSASILLTSRPSASAPLHNLPSVDRLIEVVGFNEENIKQYIETEFESCPAKASSLLNQLDDNPLIGSVCSVPLNCAIVCNLWHTLDGVLPTTLTELYTQIVLNVILRNLRKESAVDLSLENFDCIPEDLRDEFWRTCKFAYGCLLKDQIVFSERELASFFPQILSSSQKFLCFGLLQSARSLLPVGQGLSFHFAHLSIQEFLAALHLVTLSTEEKLRVVQARAKYSQFHNVWRFVFGLGYKKQNLCSTKVVCLDEIFVNMFLSCVYKSSTLLQSHCALESMDDSVSIKVARRVKGYLNRTNTPHDCMAVFHVLCHSVGYCSEVNLSLDGCGLSDTHLKQLTDILSSSNGKLQLRHLHLRNNKLTNSGVCDLFKRASASFSALENVYLKCNNITDIMQMPSFVLTTCNDTWLELSDNPLGVSGIQSLETAVQAGVLVNLKRLSLSKTLTDDADINGALLTTLLPSIASHCPHLVSLDLDRNNLGVPGACALSHMFTNFTSRCDFRLNLSDTELNSEAVIILSECVCVADVSVENGSTLDISNNPLGYDGLLALFRILRCQTCSFGSLTLNCTDCSTPTQSRNQNQNIPPTKELDLGPPLENSQLNLLNVGGNNFSGDRVFVLAECIRVCPLLYWLYCKDCSLSSADLSNLITYLKSSGCSYSHLKKWPLGNNSIEDEGVAALADCMSELFPFLWFLTLDGNPVSKEAQRKLSTCLKINKERMWVTWRKVETLRLAALTEWERAQSPPQSEELLFVFLRMWDELCWILSYMVYTRSRYPHLYGLPSELSRPATPSDDESFHSATEELDEPVGPTATNESTFPTVQSPNRMDQPCEASAVGVSSPQSLPNGTTPPMTTHGTYSGMKPISGGAASLATYPVTAWTYWRLNELKHPINGEGTIVAVLDTGINKKHAAFQSQNKLVDPNCQIDQDPESHGTAAASIVSGTHNQAYYYCFPSNTLRKESLPLGVSCEAKLAIFHVANTKQDIYDVSEIVRSLKRISEFNSRQGIVDTIRIVTMPFRLQQHEQEIMTQINNLQIMQGVICIAAAGNDGLNESPKYPAKYSNVLSVGSADSFGCKSSFSTSHSDSELCVDVLAPGENVLVAVNRVPSAIKMSSKYDPSMENRYLAIDSGTSFAAPAVAGLVALLIQCARIYGNAQTLCDITKIGVLRKLFKKHMVLRTEQGNLLQPEKVIRFFNDLHDRRLNMAYLVEEYSH